MGLDSDLVKVEVCNVEKLKGGKKKKDDDDDFFEDIGCWIKLWFIGSCIILRFKVDSFVSGISINNGNFLFL